MEYSTVLKTAMVNQIVQQADAGAGNAYITIRASTSSSGNTVDATSLSSEPLLATFPLQKPCATVQTSPFSVTFNIANQVSVLQSSGKAVWWRLHRSDGVTILKGTVSDVAGTGEIWFSATDWEADGTSSVQLNFAALGSL